MDRLAYQNIYDVIYAILRRQMVQDTMFTALPMQENGMSFLVTSSLQTSHAQHNDDEKNFGRIRIHIDEQGKIPISRCCIDQ